MLFVEVCLRVACEEWCPSLEKRFLLAQNYDENGVETNNEGSEACPEHALPRQFVLIIVLVVVALALVTLGASLLGMRRAKKQHQITDN